MKNLKNLYLWQTQATKEGVAALKKALPGCEVNIGAELTVVPPPAAAAKKQAAAKPANAKCPISGKPINAKQTSVFTKEVAFCCNNCKGKFEKNPAASIGKVNLADAKLNTKCPISGKPAKPNVKAAYKKTVAFCCGNCKGKFDKNPAGFIAKVK